MFKFLSINSLFLAALYLVLRVESTFWMIVKLLFLLMLSLTLKIFDYSVLGL